MYRDILIQNGLSKKEAELYLTVLSAGEITPTRAAQKSNLKRSTIYNLIENLKKKGIVSVHKKKGLQHISALSPRLLIEHFEDTTEKAKSILPQLINLAYASPVKPRMRFLDGIEGIKKVLFDAASSGEDYIGFIDYELMPQEVYQYIRKKVAPEREKNKNVMLKLLMPKNETNQRIAQEYKHNVEHKMVIFPSRKNHIEILIYEGSKIGFMSFVEKEMFGAIIDSEAIYQTLHDLFMLIWNQAPNPRL